MHFHRWWREGAPVPPILGVLCNSHHMNSCKVYFSGFSSQLNTCLTVVYKRVTGVTVLSIFSEDKNLLTLIFQAGACISLDNMVKLQQLRNTDGLGKSLLTRKEIQSASRKLFFES